MNELHDLKAIWLTAKTDILPGADEIVLMGKKFRRQKIRRKVFTICFSLITMALMGSVIFVYHSKMLSTRIGEFLIIINCGILASTNLKSIKRFYDLEDYNNNDFIAFLERTKQNQLYYYKKTQVIGMLLSTSGLILYLYEFVYKNLVVLIVVYATTIVYLAFIWFFIRPRIFIKNIKKVDEMIQTLQKILKQFNSISDEK